MIVAVAFFSSSRRLSAQNSEQTTQSGQAVTTTPYNPYPPGILPSNLVSEIARVQREIQGIYNNYLAQFHALPPPNFQGNPPTLQGSGYESVRILGGLLNYDLKMSVDENQACASCHMPYAGFGGPIPSVNLLPIAYPGSVHFRFGKRTPQRYTYSPRFPVLKFNTSQAAFFGGNFWDARSTGFKLQSPDAEQAQHPPLDSQEMGNPDLACIAFKISQAVYLPLYKTVWGDDPSSINFPANTAEICATPAGAAELGSNPSPIAYLRKTAPRQTISMITGASPFPSLKARTISAPSHQNSMPF